MSSKPTILVVDDDEGITSLLADYLRRFNYATRVAADEQQMWQQLADGAVDLVLLDLMLPDADGLALGQLLHQRQGLPFIILTARCDPADRVVGLEMGADDYVNKPFEPRELVARIQAVLRRSRSTVRPASPMAATPVPNELHFDGWCLHRDERLLLTPEGRSLLLSNAEYQLLATFLAAPGQIVSRAQLMAGARGRQLSLSGRSIDLLVSRLRHKLGERPGNNELIRTVRGMGYLLDTAAVQPCAA
jgi:two-component system, OmpR family, response regulator